MRLAGQLAKLERAAGKGERCAWCRLHLVHSPPRPGQRPSGRLVACPFCGTKYNRPAWSREEIRARLSESHDVVKRVSFLLNLHDPDEFYTLRRARAARLWADHYLDRCLSDRYRGATNKLLDAADRRRAARATRGRGKQSKEEREVERLREKRAALAAEANRMQARADAERAARLGVRFPDLEALKARLGAKQPGYSADSPTFDHAVEVRRWLAFAKLEKAMFKKPSFETRASLLLWRGLRQKAREKRRQEEAAKAWLEGVNREREAAGKSTFYSVESARRVLEDERERAERDAAIERARVERQAAESSASPTLAAPETDGDGSSFWGRPIEPGGVEFIGFEDLTGSSGKQQTSRFRHVKAGVEPYCPDPGQSETTVISPEFVMTDPTAGMRLTSDGRIVCQDGRPPATPDPRARYYDTDRPEPPRRYSAGGSASARRYRPRT